MKNKVKDPGSALTHFIGMILSLFAFALLLAKAARIDSLLYTLSMTIYGVSLLLLYTASTVYHTFDRTKKVNTLLKKMDHMMISVLIAGSYTPLCLLGLPEKTGRRLLCVIWGLALAGILIKAFWVFCPRWVSSLLYIGMGWVCLFAFPQLKHTLPAPAFGWLLAGGIVYTLGGVIYALKLPLFQHMHKHFGNHEVFHVFVMVGSLCHFIVMYGYLLP